MRKGLAAFSVLASLAAAAPSQAASPQAAAPQAASSQPASSQPVSPQAASPQAASPQAASPRAASPRATSATAQPATGAAAAKTSPLERINVLIVDGKLAEAAAALRTQYEATREALLLLREARLRLRLGEKDAALAGFRQFLAEAKEPHAALRAEAEAAIHELAPPPPPPSPLLEPPQLPPPPMVSTEPPSPLAQDLRLVPAPADVDVQLPDPALEARQNRKLLITGSVLLAAGYLPALVMPMVFAGFLDQEGAPTPAANFTLLVPVLGPLLSGITAPVQAIGRGEPGGPLVSSWSLPWIATSGLVQATGLAVLIVAGKRQAALRRQATPHVLVTPLARPGETGLVLSGRF